MKALVLLTLVLCLAAGTAGAATIYSVTISVTEDGQDNLIFVGNTLEWEHVGTGIGNSLSNFANGGVTGGNSTQFVNVLGNTVTPNNPYILVSGTDSVFPALNFTNQNWYNGVQGLNCPGGSGSNHLPSCPYFDSGFEYLLPFSLGSSTLITLSNVSTPALGTVLVTQQPSSGNGFTGIINFNDDFASGANVYTVTLNFANSPEPTTAMLGGLGLLALGLLKRRRKA